MDTQISLLQGKLSAMTRQLAVPAEVKSRPGILLQVKELNQLLGSFNQTLSLNAEIKKR
ncbi:hypothetical protein [Salinimonas lutimaris]|uniref:hypothetical protein n=1 Tax=Salinimonas lutimaris TaxID=914153 RepID=UPI0015864FB1|nr:hypothetical protein [Salinimonas lutimaris]